MINTGRCTIKHCVIDERVPDAVGCFAEIAVARLAAGLFPEVGKRRTSRQRYRLDLRRISVRVFHQLDISGRNVCDAQMQVICKGERNCNVTRNRRQTICRRQERSCPRSVLLGIIAAHVLGNLIVRGIVYSILAGFFKRCPAFVRVLAVVFRHGILFGKCLNGAQIDFAFLNGIIANKAAVFQRICIIICGLLVCSNVYVLFGGAVGVEQGIQIALRRAARRTEFLDAGRSEAVVQILVAIIVVLLQRLIEIRCVHLRPRNQFLDCGVQFSNRSGNLRFGCCSIQHLLRLSAGTVGSCELRPEAPVFA